MLWYTNYREDGINVQDGEAINTGNLELLTEVVTPGAVDHNAAPGQGNDPEGYIAFFAKFRSPFI